MTIIDRRQQFLEALNEAVPETKRRIWDEEAFNLNDGNFHNLEERGEFSHLRYFVNETDIFLQVPAHEDEKGNKIEGRCIQYRFTENGHPIIAKSHEENENDDKNEIDPVEKFSYSHNSAASVMNEFEEHREASMNEKIFKTGFRSLDESLSGGFRDQLVVLGAVSSLGKTTLALELANRFARDGQDVLFISLEQSRDELLSKSLSYCCAEFLDENEIDIRQGLTQNHIQDKKVFNNLGIALRRLYEPTVESFKKYAKHLYFIEPDGQISAEKVRTFVKRHVDMTGNYPIVFVDYLQLLCGYDIRQTDKQAVDYNILALRQIVRDYKIPLFAISSVNRASYNETSSMGIFKESGAIEYSCDVALALEYSNYKKELNNVLGDKKTPTESDKVEALRECSNNGGKGYREVTLAIMKNRRGKKDMEVKLSYYAAQNFFKEK